MKNIFYRPEWTCGKYNAQKHVAIMYNLIAGGEFFFENDSADVVELILKAGRNGEISVPQVSKILNITPESILSFFESLIENGLLTTKQFTKDDIASYRKQILERPIDTVYVGKDVESFSSCNFTGVEQVYANAVKDCTDIVTVGFELTYRCSERCLHCYNIGATRNDTEKSGRNLLSELSLDDYKRIIDEMCDAGLAIATITGGDPFANKDVWDILEYLYAKDIAVTILTNGQQLVNQIDRLVDLYPKKVNVSIYGADPQAHDYITRKKGSWQTSLDVIAALRSNAVPMEISCVLMRPGLKSYLKLKEIGQQLRCPVIFDVAVIDSIEGDVCATKNLRLTPQELELVMMDPDIQENSLHPEAYSNPAPATGIPCQAGRGMFCVMPDGKLIPCLALHLILGDLKVSSFNSIVKGNTALVELLETNASKYFECGTHEYCNCCVYCAGNSFSKNGTPFSSNENNCFIARNRYSLMKKLKEGVDVLNGKTLQSCIEDLPDFTFPEFLQREYKDRVNEFPKNTL